MVKCNNGEVNPSPKIDYLKFDLLEVCRKPRNYKKTYNTDYEGKYLH